MACPHDTLLGIGLSKEDSRAWNEKTWRGRNLLGASLTKVRDILMAGHLKKGTVTQFFVIASLHFFRVF